MTRRLVVHVGPHKTGSTYLQSNLHRTRRQLRHSGWLYPRIGPDARAHHELAHSADPTRQIAHLNRIWAQAPNMSLLLSSEGFSAWSPERFHALRVGVNADQIELIHVLRDPVERLASYWAEEVKHGKTESLPERLARELTNPYASNLLNPALGLRPFLRDPKVRLHLVPYEYLSSCGRDLFEHIATRVLNLEDVKAKPGPANERLPLEITEFLRFLNMHSATPSAALRLAFMARTSPRERADIVRLISAEARGAHKRLTVPADAAFLRHIETRVRQELRNSFTCDPGSASVFRNTTHSFPYYADAGLWLSGAVREKANDILGRIAA